MRRTLLLTRREKDLIRGSPCEMCGAIPIIENGERCHPHRIIPRCEGGLYIENNVVPRCPSCHDVEHGGDGTAPFLGACTIGGRKGAHVMHKRYPELAKVANAQWRVSLSKAEWAIIASQGGQQTIRNGGGWAAIHKKYPNMARECAIKTNTLHPDLVRAGGRKGGLIGGHRVHEIHPNLASENGKKYGQRGGRIGGRRTHELHPDLAKKCAKKLNELYPDRVRYSGKKAMHICWHIERGITKSYCLFCVDTSL